MCSLHDADAAHKVTLDIQISAQHSLVIVSECTSETAVGSPSVWFGGWRFGGSAGPKFVFLENVTLALSVCGCELYGANIDDCCMQLSCC